MKKRVYLPYLAVIMMMNVAPTSMWAAEPARQSRLIAKAQSAYRTLKDDMSCFFSRKKTCTRAQKKRIAIAAAAVVTTVAVLVATGFGIRALVKHEAAAQRRTDLTQQFFRAAEEGNAWQLQVLLDQGLDVERIFKGRHYFGSDWAPDELDLLPGAAARGYYDVARFLLDHGAGVDEYYESGRAIWSAVQNGHANIVGLLLDRGARMDKGSYGWTLLHSAARAGHRDVVKLLLDRDADVGEHSSPSYIFGSTGGDPSLAQAGTPLHEAADQGHYEVVELLLDRGAAVDSRDRFGRTPLHNAVQGRHDAVARLLKERGADPEALDATGDKPHFIRYVVSQDEL